jgi:glycosyltransferase involved in cell wall biosynthesis
MNMPSFQQDGLFEALSLLKEVDLKVVFAHKLTPDRVQLGWKEDVRDYSFRILSSKPTISEAVRIALSERDRLHVVNGIWAEPAFAAALSALALAGSTFAVYAEAPDPTLPRPKSKLLLREAFGRRIARRARGIVAVSRLAVDFYSGLGFPGDRVYPFGYFRSNKDRTSVSGELIDRQKKEVIFVGQLIHRKAWDVLLEAIQPLFALYPDLRLAIVGDGEDASTVDRNLRSLGIKDRVVLEGVISSDKIRERIASADLLVLPSRWDGWGMVINEAFSVGVPVIASDRCGASDLIRQSENGYVFRSEDVEDLRRCLRNFLDDSGKRAAMRAAARSTGRVISAEAAAPYLVECLKHMTGARDERPVPPWAQVVTSQGADR